MRRFGDLESDIMEVLWSAAGPMTVRQVREELHARRSSAYTTVMTVVDNLHRKGFLERDEGGRAYLYWPRQSREAYVADLMREALGDTADQATALMHFVRDISPDEAELLRQAMRQTTRQTMRQATRRRPQR